MLEHFTDADWQRIKTVGLVTACILDLSEQGKEPKEIAAMLGLSRPSVVKVVKGDWKVKHFEQAAYDVAEHIAETLTFDSLTAYGKTGNLLGPYAKAASIARKAAGDGNPCAVWDTFVTEARASGEWKWVTNTNFVERFGKWLADKMTTAQPTTAIWKL